MKLPAASNSITGGAGTQHWETGGFCAAPASSLVSERGRCKTQIWSCASTVMPPIWPMIQLLGSCLGQLGSTLKCGPSASAAYATKANPKKNTEPASLVRCDIDMQFPEFCGGESLHLGEPSA